MAEASLGTQDYSKTTVANASTLLIQGGRWKKAWRSMAPTSADLWVNPAGGVAGPNLPGSFLIKAGIVFGSQADIVETTNINYYCTASGLIIPVVVWF